MVFGKKEQENVIFVLGSPRKDGNIAILCRSNGENIGPAYCPSKKDALNLKTRLLNDPRGMHNHRALEIIKNLYIYKIPFGLEPAYEAGQLWAYLPKEMAVCVEATHH